MKNKKLIAILVIFVGVMLVAGVLYSRLGEGISAAGLGTTATEATTEATEETEEATEATTEVTTEATEAPTQETEAAAEEEVHIVPAWDFTAVDVNGNEVNLSDYFGKPIVLNFWAYWCSACQSEMFRFNEKYEELGGEVVFLMTHVGPDLDEGKALIAENGYTFPVIYDVQRIAAAGYGVNAYPTTFFIDKDGNLQGYYIGTMSSELLQVGIDLIYTP